MTEKTQKVRWKFKIAFIGDSAVGKTSLILRYVKNFFKEDLKSTIGTNFMVKTVEIDGTTIQLLIYDIGAQDTFKSMRTRYFHGSNASIAVFDLTRLNTLYALPEWINSVKETCGNIPFAIVGNKSDLVEERTVPRVDAEGIANRFSCLYEELSAKTGDNVESLFEKITREILKDPRFL